MNRASHWHRWASMVQMEVESLSHCMGPFQGQRGEVSLLHRQNVHRHISYNGLRLLLCPMGQIPIPSRICPERGANAASGKFEPRCAKARPSSSAKLSTLAGDAAPSPRTAWGSLYIGKGGLQRPRTPRPLRLRVHRWRLHHRVCPVQVHHTRQRLIFTRIAEDLKRSSCRGS